MRPVFIDFETYWSDTHSLSRMSPIDYCLSPETEIISCAIKFDRYPTDVFFGEEQIRHVFSKLDWSDIWVIAHNMSGFDSMLLAWRFGIRPALWGCTLAMARPLHAKTTGLSLAKLVQHYGIGHKQDAILHSTRGRHLEDFTSDELRAMETYNKADTEQCAALFHILKKYYSPEELWHLDCNIRMLVEPKFELDTGLLETALSVERSNKHKALTEVAALLRDAADPEDGFWDQDDDTKTEWVREQLASAPKFSALLESRGVEVPMKPSPTNPDKQVPALAKTDEAFQELQEHEDPVVASAARARLAVKSTILETRIEALQRAAAACHGRLPVALNYCGADTTGRDAGAFNLNMQNLPRINPDKPKVSDALRNSLRAPDGYLIGVADQSGIELRVNHFLWQVPSSMALYQASPDKADLYRAFAAAYYTKAPEDVTKTERQFAKVCQLLLQYGGGPVTFRKTARIQGGVLLDEAGAENAVSGWRRHYHQIVDGWARCGEALTAAYNGRREAVDPWGLVTTEEDALRLPSGRLIRYPGLRFVDDGLTWPDGRPKKSWVYADGRHKTYLSPPKVSENCVQALARDSVFECALRFYKLTRLRPILRVHDELVYLFPQSEAEDLLATLQRTMRTPPSWWPDLVVWSEGAVAETYGACK